MDGPGDLKASITYQENYWTILYDQVGLTDQLLQHDYPGNGTEESPFLVDFLPNDPRDPMKFDRFKKWSVTFVQALATLAVSFASSAYSGGIKSVIQSFQVSTTVAILGVSLFVLGFAIGPLFWAPLSELFGRQRLFIITFTILTIFNAAAAASQSMHTLLILRFCGGAFGSAPLANAGGIIADMFDASQRGLAGALFSAAPFLGPALGPIAGGFLGHAYGWRWNQGMMAIFTGIVLIASLCVCPETYAPYLLKQRAKALTKATGRVYKSKVEGRDTTLSTVLLRPLVLLTHEPIVLLTSLYLAIIFGTLYMFFAAFPIVFQTNRGWSPGIGGLPFIGVTIGMLVAVIYVINDNKRYVSAAKKAVGGIPDPEVRLPPAVLGSFLLPIGLFWFAWTNGKEIHWISPVVASGFFGTGLLLVFLSMLNYLVDTYVVFAASVLAANSVLRSLFGTAFPLFTAQMYDGLGIHWATSIPAFLTLLCLPCPYLFMRYGAKIRARCKYAREASEVLDKLREAVIESQDSILGSSHTLREETHDSV